MAEKKPNLTPTEDMEQYILAQYLDMCGVLWHHTPNEGARRRVQNKSGQWFSPEGNRLKKLGVKSGTPDCLIFESVQTFKGIAIELKRQKGARSKVSPEQQEWLDRLSKRGWLALACYGADEAIALLKQVGVKPGGCWD